MYWLSAARSQRDALTQAGAGIAVSRRKSGDSARWFRKHASCIPAGSEEEMVRTLAPLALAFALLAGCATGHPRIADLKYDPGRYQNHSVTVDGVVTSSWGVPLVPFKLYKVDDGTGEVTVVSQDGRAPSKGARVSVKGRVTEFGTFGGSSVGLHLRQEHLKYKGY
jgi:hypothetical protein